MSAESTNGIVLGEAWNMKGNLDCSANPNYPEGLPGDTYKVSVAGKIGGASGVTVEAGDFVVCVAANDGGTEASVGSNWGVLQFNIVNALTKAGGTLTGALNYAPQVDVASATTTDIGAAASNSVRITGTTPITGFTAIATGAVRRVTFAGALTLTHNATSLILPGGANITTAAGDTAEFESLGSGNWRCTHYNKASGAAVVAAGSATRVTKAATEQVTASDTLQDDDELTFTVLANKTYRIKLNIIYYDGSGNAIKALLKVPSFADPQNGRTDEDNMLLSNGATLKVGKFTASAATVTGLSINSASGEYILHVGSTGGAVVLKWAQSVASGNGKVYAGSFIEYEQLD